MALPAFLMYFFSVVGVELLASVTQGALFRGNGSGELPASWSPAQHTCDPLWVFLPNCHSGFQQWTRCSDTSSVVGLSLSPLLIASCSNALEAGCPSLSASAPVLLAFFVSVLT